MATPRTSAASFLVCCLLAAGCGGSGEDPEKVLAATFGGLDKSVDSGRVEATISLTEQGVVAADVGLSGNFDGGAGNPVPSFDLRADVDANAQGQPVQVAAGLLSTGKSAFLLFNERAYRVDDATFAEFRANLESADADPDAGADVGGLLSRFGIDPLSWLSGLSYVGTEEIGGVETDHVSATPDVTKLLEDLTRFARRTGQADAVEAGQLGLLGALVVNPRVDIYSGREDRIIRRFDLSFEIGGVGDGAAAVKVSFVLSEINEPQQIVAPQNAQPLSALTRDLSQLEQALAPATGSDGGSGSAGTDSTDAYLDCLADAAGPDEIAACAG